MIILCKQSVYANGSKYLYNILNERRSLLYTQAISYDSHSYMRNRIFANYYFNHRKVKYILELNTTKGWFRIILFKDPSENNKFLLSEEHKLLI
jgi:hypothetical protein